MSVQITFEFRELRVTPSYVCQIECVCVCVCVCVCSVLLHKVLSRTREMEERLVIVANSSYAYVNYLALRKKFDL
jgi:hypothetical protein